MKLIKATRFRTEYFHPASAKVERLQSRVAELESMGRAFRACVDLQMPPSMEGRGMSDSREAFEQIYSIPTGAEWCEKRHIYIHKNYSGLVLHPINESWEAFCEGALWQASREALEGEPIGYVVPRMLEAMQAGKYCGISISDEQKAGDIAVYTHPASADDSKHHAVSQGVTGAGDGGQHIDDIAVDRFAEAMKQKLAKQRQKGYGGWNDKELCPDGRLQKYLGAHLGKGDPVDIGNFAMMIWNRGESVTDAGVPDADYIRALQDALDIIQADANTEENYDSLRRIGSVLANIKAKQEQGQ